MTNEYIFGAFVPLTPLMPFLVIAIGVDDLYILLDAFDKLDHLNDDPVEKARA